MAADILGDSQMVQLINQALLATGDGVRLIGMDGRWERMVAGYQRSVSKSSLRSIP